MKATKQPSNFLNLIPGRNCYKIGPVSGQRLIAETKLYWEPTRSIYLNARFPSNRGKLTGITKVRVYDLNPKIFGVCVFLKKFFNRINLEMEEICLTQHQIISFVQRKPKFFEDENGKTIFLIKGEKTFSVACAEPRYHYGGPIKLTPIDLSETLFIERVNLRVVLPERKQ